MEKTVSRNLSKFLIFSIIGILYFFVPLAPTASGGRATWLVQSVNFRFTESSQTKANREDARREADNVLLFLRSEGYIRLKADSAIPSAALYSIYCLWCSDNAYKPRSARTVSMTLKKHADEFGLEHDNHIQNALGKRVNGFWGIEALVAPPVV